MDYFSVLNLNKEPFSNSPDPDFFYHSREHVDCLQKLELSILLRRGLNVIIGDVGTGKTTLCRQLIRKLSKGKAVETHLVLDPHFADASEFLFTTAKMFTGNRPPKGSNNWQLREYIKQYLYRSGVDQEKTTVLIIDEGQKIPVFCLEILREFLNYETNEYKLLQIVIFAQKEFEKTIQKHPNFADRINLYHHLKPLSFSDTRSMIKFRLEQSRGSGKRLDLFTLPALASIYRATEGYPRKIINLCHQSILAMIIQNRTTIRYFLVRSCARRLFPHQSRRAKKLIATAVIAGCLAAILLFLGTSNPLKAYLPWDAGGIKTAFLPKEKPLANNPAAGPTSTGPKPQIPPAAGPLPMPSEPTPVPSPEPPFAVEVQTEVPPPVKTEAAAVVEIQSDPIEDSSPTMDTYAEVLGSVILRPNETLSAIIQKIYGSYNSKYFKSLIFANPAIEDPDRVDVGQTIDLPAIPARVKPLAKKIWWVQVEEKDSLADAYDYVRSYPRKSPPVRLIPYWTSKAGTKFAVVLKKYFSSEDAARRQLEELTPNVSSAGKIISLWNEKAVFFADPFLGGSQKN